MSKTWQLINLQDPSSLPQYNQEIDFSIAEGKGAPFSTSGRMKADLNTIRHLLESNPGSLMIWQPSQPPAKAPASYEIKEKTYCNAPLCHQIKCEHCRNGVCLSSVPDKHCHYAETFQTLVLPGGGVGQ